MKNVLCAIMMIVLSGAPVAAQAQDPPTPAPPQLQTPAGALTPENFAMLKAKAEAGDLDAQASMAAWLVVGSPGVPANPREAERLLRAGAARSHMRSVFLLAAFLMAGALGFKKDDVEGVKLFTLCATTATDRAIRGECDSSLAMAYRRGWDVPRDEAASVRWLRVGAELEDRESMNWLGWAYLLGKWGVEKNYTTALRWLRPAADKGQAEAAAYMGEMYLAGGPEVVKDVPKGIALLTVAAEHGSAISATGLSVRYLLGKAPFVQDDAKAFHFAQIGARSGNTVGASLLGFLYARGQGTERNDLEALRWDRFAAAKGDVNAMFELFMLNARSEGRLFDAPESMSGCVKRRRVAFPWPCTISALPMKKGSAM
jgi:TPR repeat protein